MRHVAVLAGLLFVVSAQAIAQSNIIGIDQQGSANTLVTEQPTASGSFVGGLPSVDNFLSLSPSSLTPVTRVETLLDDNGQPVRDEDDNEVQVEVAVPNAFVGSSAPSVAALRPTDPLNGPLGSQVNALGGSGNTLGVTVSGRGGAALFSQTNTGGAVNTGTIDVTGNGTAVLFQNGFDNTATVSANADANAAIFQNGIGNTGNLNALTSTNGVLIQDGNNNTSGDVTLSAVGSDVTYIQRGNNLSPAGEALSVIGDAASITIIQSNIFAN